MQDVKGEFFSVTLIVYRIVFLGISRVYIHQNFLKVVVHVIIIDQ